MGYETKLIAADGNSKELIEAFNKVPRDYISRYVYSGRAIDLINPDRLKEFMAKADVDALMFVRGIDHVSSGGLNALRVAVAVLGTGISSGVAHTEFSLLNRDSHLLYYGHSHEDGKDLRTESGVNYLVAEIVDELRDLRGKN